MNKEQIMEFTAKCKKEEEIISKMFEEKQKKFAKHQEAVINHISQMIQDFFQEEIFDLINEYIKSNKHLLVVNNLWINTESSWDNNDCNIRRITIRLNPNDYCCEVVGFFSDEFKLFSHHYETFYYKRTDINELNEDIKHFERRKNQFKDYEMLEKKLENNIEEIYKFLAEWKQKQMEKQISLLSSINYEDEQIKRYKVSIIIEEM